MMLLAPQTQDSGAILAGLEMETVQPRTTLTVVGVFGQKLLCTADQNTFRLVDPEDFQLSDKSVAVLQDRLRETTAHSPDHSIAPIEDHPLGVVSLMGKVSLAGHVASRPGGWVEVLPMDSEKPMRFREQALYGRIDNLSALDLERLGGVGLYCGLETDELFRRIDGNGTDGKAPVLGMVVELRENRQRWVVWEFEPSPSGHTHLLLSAVDNDGHQLRGRAQLLSEADWHKQVHTVYTHFPKPMPGMQIRWTPKDAPAVEGVVLCRIRLLWTEPLAVHTPAPVERYRDVILLTNGQRVPADEDWGAPHIWRVQEYFEASWSVVSLPYELGVLMEPSQVPVVSLGAMEQIATLAQLYAAPLPDAEMHRLRRAYLEATGALQAPCTESEEAYSDGSSPHSDLPF